MRSASRAERVLIVALLTTATAGLRSSVHAQEPLPLPMIPRVSTTDPLTQGLAISEVKSIRKLPQIPDTSEVEHSGILPK